MIENDAFEAALADPANQSIMRRACRTFAGLGPDVLEQCMCLALWKCLGRAFESRRHFEAILYKSTWRKCVDAARSNSHFRRRTVPLASVPEPLAASPEADLDDTLEELDDADRDLLVGRYLEGRPRAEMSRELGISGSTLRRRLRDARDRLAGVYS